MGKFRDKLVEIKHNSRFLTWMWYLGRQPLFIFREQKIKAAAKKRAAGYEDDRYLSIKKYKGLHKGERCFIVATGPSLRLSDLDMLNNEYTFGMNAIPLLFDQTEWRPTYYGIQDFRAYEKMEGILNIAYKEADNVFVADVIANRFTVPSNFNIFPHDLAYNFNQLEIEKYFAKFSGDCYSIIYDGYTITYSLIQLAIYMGFSELYLLGVDCNYKKGEKNHIVETGAVDKNEDKNYEKMIVAYKEAKKYADEHDIKIINCTRGGMLDIYPRMPLEEALKEKV